MDAWGLYNGCKYKPYREQKQRLNPSIPFFMPSNLEISTFFYIFAQMEVIYKGFTVKDDGTAINRFGKKVGYKQKNGYMYVSINGKQVLMHRFVYEAFNGEIPEGYEIDHKNTVRDDNRLENLRLATPKENRNNPITKERYKTSNKGKVTPL